MMGGWKSKKGKKGRIWMRLSSLLGRMTTGLRNFSLFSFFRYFRVITLRAIGIGMALIGSSGVSALSISRLRHLRLLIHGFHRLDFPV
jgi:hypothetical protein